jgi:hypothetical protein
MRSNCRLMDTVGGTAGAAPFGWRTGEADGPDAQAGDGSQPVPTSATDSAARAPSGDVRRPRNDLWAEVDITYFSDESFASLAARRRTIPPKSIPRQAAGRIQPAIAARWSRVHNRLDRSRGRSTE